MAEVLTADDSPSEQTPSILAVTYEDLYAAYYYSPNKKKSQCYRTRWQPPNGFRSCDGSGQELMGNEWPQCRFEFSWPSFVL
ncbi:hypothetical protein PoB_005813600 [Plakobranchus ocellatus]|uniref:Uncharacterized protein n=1 Tax=Plakobranchus ocellatus TaxID=259542 RepID=A0AAV4C8J8_9GAST|nr:hypothetical protein PoB_005813600 [Plakobranchus ocellatus]